MLMSSLEEEMEPREWKRIYNVPVYMRDKKLTNISFFKNNIIALSHFSMLYTILTNHFLITPRTSYIFDFK